MSAVPGNSSEDISMTKYIFSTKRLNIRKATTSDTDISFLFDLWTNPHVMKFIDFSHGLEIFKEQIKNQILDQDDTEFDARLIIEAKGTSEIIGQCKLGKVSYNGISETDVKFSPLYWGKGFGKEIKQALIYYLFTNTNCEIIKATPNKQNIASIKMQEAVGGERIEEFAYNFPDHMRDYTCPVHGYVYHVSRDKWETRKRNATK